MIKKLLAIFGIHTNAEKSQNNTDSSSDEMVTNEAIEETGLRLVGNPQRGYFIALGNHRLTGYHKTKKAAKELVNKRAWEIILNSQATMIALNNTALNLEPKP